MDKARLETFRTLLQERLDGLSAKLGSRIGHLVDQREALSDHTDIATEESDRDMVLRLNEHDRRLASLLQHALRRVEEGEYGICMECGDDIAERRLLASPTATHCIDCMTDLEARMPA